MRSDALNVGLMNTMNGMYNNEIKLMGVVKVTMVATQGL
jgi:hypothetical protein